MGSSSWGARARMGGGVRRACAPGQLRRSGVQRFAAVCRPPWGCPMHVALLGVAGPGRAAVTAASCSLLLLPRPAPLSSSCSPAGSLPIPTPTPGVRGAGRKHLPPRRGVNWAGPRRAPDCGAGGQAGTRAIGVRVLLQPCRGCCTRFAPARRARPHSSCELQAPSE